MSSMISTRSQQFTESVIREMTRLALEHKAVNLAQGFPDHELPQEIMEAAIKAMRDGLNQYAITWGTKNLRNAIARKVAWYQGIEIDPERDITVTCGSTEAMVASLLAVINPGDEVIIFEPFYENYGPDSILSNATPRFVTMYEPEPYKGDRSTLQNSNVHAEKFGDSPHSGTVPSWRFKFDELEAAFNKNTKAIIINTPNNPTGKVFSKDELTFISELCQKWDCLAITDEIYEHILYDGEKHISIATLPGMWERTITINSISKTYSATGWRVGWAIAPSKISASIRKVHDFLTVGAPHPLQEGAAAGLLLPLGYYEEVAKDYAKRRQFLLDTLTNAGFKCWIPWGAYYIIADFAAIPQSSKFKNDTEFAHWLAKEIGVASVPGSSFYRKPFLGATKLRFSFGRNMEILESAAQRLAKLR